RLGQMGHGCGRAGGGLGARAPHGGGLGGSQPPRGMGGMAGGPPGGGSGSGMTNFAGGNGVFGGQTKPTPLSVLRVMAVVEVKKRVGAPSGRGPRRTTGPDSTHPPPP